jgi:hypothetical protein
MKATESVRLKVTSIFHELVGKRSESLSETGTSTRAALRIERAHRAQYGVDVAHDVAFHMTDWNSDAAFIVALQLFPERFTPDEIRVGLTMFLIHAPNHIRAVCRLTGWEHWINFKLPKRRQAATKRRIRISKQKRS